MIERLIALIVIIWLFIPTSVFLQPIDFSYEGTEIEFTRKINFVKVIYADWSTEIVVEDTGLSCFSSGSSFYESSRLIVRYTAEEELHECLDAEGDKIFRNKWVAYLFGFIPLRPLSNEFLINSPGYYKEGE